VCELTLELKEDSLTRFPQAYELSVLTGTQVLLLVVSETGLVYTFTTPKLQPLVTKAEGKNLIQVSDKTRHCLSRILRPAKDGRASSMALHLHYLQSLLPSGPS
jgi:hypothetical protein